MALVLLSGVVCVFALWTKIQPDQLPPFLIFLTTVNLSSLGLLCSIVARVRKLRNDVNLVAKGNDLSLRLRVIGNDEVSDLGNNINIMLAALEESQEYLVVARDAAEAADRSKTALVEQLRHREMELRRLHDAGRQRTTQPTGQNQ